MIESGARVVGVDPDVNAGLIPEGVILCAEAYRAEHLHGACLAFAAASPEVNLRVVSDAKTAGIWVNAASEPGGGDFQIPAVWRDGSLTVTVATAGASPALAVALRDRIAEDRSGRRAAGLVAVMAELRPVVLARLCDPEARRRVLADWGDPRWLDLFDRGGPDAVRVEVLRALECEARGDGLRELIP